MLRDETDLTVQAKLGAPAFPPRWSNGKAMLIGYLAGLGRSARAIADHLADGTTVETIRAQWRRHGIVDRSGGTEIPVTIGGSDLGRLEQLAAARGIEPREWLRQVAAAAIRDNLFDAVVDVSPAKPPCRHGGDRHSAAFHASRLT